MTRYLCFLFVLGSLVSTGVAAERYRVGGPLAGIEDGQTPGSPEKWAAYFGYAHPMFDRQSELRRWNAADLAELDRSLEIVSSRPASNSASQPQPVSETVAVVRLAVGQPAIPLDLGTLDEGLYVVRAIAAVCEENVRSWRKPVFVTLRINDGPNGEVTAHRIRASYNEDFYCVAEIFFHALQQSFQWNWINVTLYLTGNATRAFVEVKHVESA